jgi:hypothetical protein
VPDLLEAIEVQEAIPPEMQRGEKGWMQKRHFEKLVRQSV